MFSVAAFAAGSGYADSVLMNSDSRYSAEEMAIDAYNYGLKQRDKAWEYEQKAATQENGKQKEKLLSKARKAHLKSIDQFEKALNYNPHMYQAWSSLGYALRKTGAFDKSLTAYKKALAINPDYYEAIEYQAEAHLQLHNYEAVKSAYARLAQEHPEYAGKLLQAIQEWLPAQNPDSSGSSELRTFADWADGHK